jgi:phosphatidylserine decarboxylase
MAFLLDSMADEVVKFPVLRGFVVVITIGAVVIARAVCFCDSLHAVSLSIVKNRSKFVVGVWSGN